MKSFEAFIKKREVIKVHKDLNLGKSLLEQAERRLKHVEQERITGDNRDFIIEDYYEVLRTLTDALLALKGYKTYSHEASIAQLQDDKEISPKILESFDRLRRQRHGSRYYGERQLLSDAEEARLLAQELVPKLKKKIKQLLEE